MKKLTNYLLGLAIVASSSMVFSPAASANDSPNWTATKVNSFSLETSSSLSSRGLVTVRGAFPARSAEYDQALQKQQLNGGTSIGFCKWTLKDAAYPGYADVGGVGILVTGTTLPKDKINSDSFSIKGIRYTTFMSGGPTDYLPMDIWSRLGEKFAITLNGSDLLFSSKGFSNGRDVNFNLKEVTASFSTDGWPEGSYQVSVAWNDGCSDVFVSSPITISLGAIPSPKWSCSAPTSIRADEAAKITCNSTVPVSLLPFHLEAFQGGAWVDLNHGTANGKSVTVTQGQLPTGANSLRFRTESLTNQYSESTSAEFNIQVVPAPYTTKCSTSSAVRVGEYFDVSCLATSNIDGAMAHLQSLSSNKWVNISDGQWSSTNLAFPNLSFSKTGSGTLRVVTDAQAGKYLGNTSTNMVVSISAAASSSASSGGNSSSSGGTSGALQVSVSYPKVVIAGRRYSAVVTTSPAVNGQCTYYLFYRVRVPIGQASLQKGKSSFTFPATKIGDTGTGAATLTVVCQAGSLSGYGGAGFFVTQAG